MELVQKNNLIRHARIKALRYSTHQGVKRNMDGTLGLENLSLEEPAAPRNASGANGGKCGRAEDKASLPSESGSTIPRVTGVPSVPRGSGFSVQKSALSVIVFVVFAHLSVLTSNTGTQRPIRSSRRLLRSSMEDGIGQAQQQPSSERQHLKQVDLPKLQKPKISIS